MASRKASRKAICRIGILFNCAAKIEDYAL